MTQLDPRIEKIRHRLGYGWNHDELLLLMEAEIERLRAGLEEIRQLTGRDDLPDAWRIAKIALRNDHEQIAGK